MSSFTDDLVVRAIQKKKRPFVVERPFGYEVGDKGSGDLIRVPRGFETDFASVPGVFRCIVSPIGRHGKAAVLHDRLYATGERRSRRESDLIFLEAMQVLGVSPWRRYVMYGAVRLFGWWAWYKHRRKP